MAETLLLVTQFFNSFHGTEGAKPQLFRRTQVGQCADTRRMMVSRQKEKKRSKPFSRCPTMGMNHEQSMNISVHITLQPQISERS